MTHRSRRDQVGGQERPPRVEEDVRIVLWRARRAWVSGVLGFSVLGGVLEIYRCCM